MIIDCDECAVRGPACAECVVTVLLGLPGAASEPVLDLDDTERQAVAALAGAGLVPPLRLVASCTHGDERSTPREEIAG